MAVSTNPDYLRVGTAADWTASGLVLREGEDGAQVDDNGNVVEIRYGNGVDVWDDLTAGSPVGAQPGAGGFTPADYQAGAYTIDPRLATATKLLTSGTLYLARTTIADASRCLLAALAVTVVATGTTYSKVGVYDALTLDVLGKTGANVNVSSATGIRENGITWTTPPRNGQAVYLGYLATVDTTMPTVVTGPSGNLAALAMGPLVSGGFPLPVIAKIAGLTTLPDTITGAVAAAVTELVFVALKSNEV